MKNKVLIVVDMQNDFIDGALGTPEAVKIVPFVKSKLEKYINDDWKVIFTMDTHKSSYLTTREGNKLPVEHCIEGTDGWQITGVLAEFAGKSYAVIKKETFGAKNLPEVLSGLDPSEIELAGLCTDICVISNALLVKAFYPEIPVSVDASCCAGVTPASHSNALEAMKMCQIEILQPKFI